MHFYKKFPDKGQKILKAMLDRIYHEFDYSILFKNLLIDIEKNSIEKKLIKNRFDNLKKNEAYLSINGNYFKKSILNKFDYLYSDYVYKGKRIYQYWPFINLETVTIIKNKNTFTNKLFYILFKKGDHLKSLNHVISRDDISAEINKIIHRTIIYMRYFYGKLLIPFLIKLNLKK